MSTPHSFHPMTLFVALCLTICLLGLISSELVPVVSAQAPTAAATADPFDAVRALYKYDPSVQVTVKEISTEKRGAITIHSIVYPSAKPNEETWGSIMAYLVVPEGKGPFPGVLYSHWMGSSQASREEFLDEAVDLASKGVVSLLVNNIWLYANSFKGNVESDSSAIVQQVIDLRRGLDILASQSNVDPKRLAFVGHEMGAMYGALLSAVDPRPKGYVLMTFLSEFTDGPGMFAVTDQTYLKQLKPFGPINYLGHAQAPLFLQFGGADFIAKDKIDALYKVAPEPKQIAIYDGVGHNLKDDKAYQERQIWLLALLGLTSAS